MKNCYRTGKKKMITNIQFIKTTQTCTVLQVIPFRSAQKIVRLHTDPVSTRSGFHIKVKQVECPSSVSDKTGSGFDFNRPWKPGSNDGPGSNWTFDGIDWNRPDHTDHRPGHREDTPDFPHIPADRGTGHHGDG